MEKLVVLHLIGIKIKYYIKESNENEKNEGGNCLNNCLKNRRKCNKMHWRMLPDRLLCTLALIGHNGTNFTYIYIYMYSTVFGMVQ